MGRLIKMDFYRLFRSKLFWVTNIILFGLNFLINFAIPVLTDWSRELLRSTPDSGVSEAELAAMSESNHMHFADLLSNPLSGLFMVILFVSATGFLYADIKDGYIKNIAGQISKKGYTAFSKFIAILFHNAFFMVTALLSSTLAILICPKATLAFDGDMGDAFVSFLVNYLLGIALTSIALFFTAALGNKTLGIVIGVLFSVGALNLIYLGINKVIDLINIKNFDITKYMPDTLYGHVFKTSETVELCTALAVALIFTTGFIALSIFIINKKDVK